MKHAKAGRDTLVVAGTEAGGIATGRQMAACTAMGAAVVWTASVWQSTAEVETTPTLKKKTLASISRDTVRSLWRTGNPARRLRSAWTEGWHGECAPGPLPMPPAPSVPVLAKIDKLAPAVTSAQRLAPYPVGQTLGLMNTDQSAHSIVYEFKKDDAEATATEPG